MVPIGREEQSHIHTGRVVDFFCSVDGISTG